MGQYADRMRRQTDRAAKQAEERRELRDALAELRRHAESNGTTPALHEICKRVDALLARVTL